MEKILLEIKNLSKNYHNKQNEIKAIANLNLNIYQNEILTIVESSGCGKSTFLSIISSI